MKLTVTFAVAPSLHALCVVLSLSVLRNSASLSISLPVRLFCSLSFLFLPLQCASHSLTQSLTHSLTHSFTLCTATATEIEIVHWIHSTNRSRERERERDSSKICWPTSVDARRQPRQTQIEAAGKRRSGDEGATTPASAHLTCLHWLSFFPLFV